HAGRVLAQRVEHALGRIGERVGQHHHAGGAVERGQPADREAVVELLDRRVERRRLAGAQGRRPHGDPRARLDLVRAGEYPAGAATADENARLEHRLVGFLPVAETSSVAEHARRAHAEIDQALAAGRAPIVVGGTGLYLRAALAELDLKPAPPPELRARLTERL